ncbi:MAG TPA: glutaredoxin domain-containing protein [Methanomicrobiales archaeon]|nr:glutaredoxin domain-containing protein [Methanomicrobiales archaeon]
MPRQSMALIMLVMGVLALVLVYLLTGPLSPAPSTTGPSVPSYVEYVPGADHGVVLLVGRSTCPHCQEDKKLLGEMNVGYYWVDLNTLDQANTTQVLNAISFCGDLSAVPILIINNRPPCIIGYNATRIRGALG